MAMNNICKLSSGTRSVAVLRISGQPSQLRLETKNGPSRTVLLMTGVVALTAELSTKNSRPSREMLSSYLGQAKPRFMQDGGRFFVFSNGYSSGRSSRNACVSTFATRILSMPRMRMPSLIRASRASERELVVESSPYQTINVPK